MLRTTYSVKSKDTDPVFFTISADNVELGAGSIENTEHGLRSVTRAIKRFCEGRPDHQIVFDITGLPQEAKNTFSVGYQVALIDMTATKIKADVERTGDGPILRRIHQLQTAVICKSVAMGIQMRDYTNPSLRTARSFDLMIEQIKHDPSADWLRAVMASNTDDFSRAVACGDDSRMRYAILQILKLSERRTPVELGWRACQHIAELALYPGEVGTEARRVIKTLVRNVSLDNMPVIVGNVGIDIKSQQNAATKSRGDRSR